MRAGETVPKVIVLLAVLALPKLGHAQAGNSAVNLSTVVRGGVVVVSYDLISNNPAAEFSVVLEASSDGGKTFNVRPRTMKGDVGPAVRAGMGKQITWEAAKDVENLDVDRYRYRVVAQPVRGQALAARASEPAQPPPVVQVGSGNGRRWGGIALMGAGGALAVLGTTALKKDDYYTNKPLVWAGIAAAAGGATLLAIGGRSSSEGTQVVIRPSGVMIQHRFLFRANRASGRP